LDHFKQTLTNKSHIFYKI